MWSTLEKFHKLEEKSPYSGRSEGTYNNVLIFGPHVVFGAVSLGEVECELE